MKLGKYLLLMLVVFAQPVFAESVFLVPGESWGFQFNSPKLVHQKGTATETEYQFEASADIGFVVSGFVEPSLGKGKSRQECKAYYWALSSKNSNILKNTVKVINSSPFVVVSYMVDVVYKGSRYIQPNANYYGYRDGKCIDFHISQIFTYDAQVDYKNLIEFAKTFGYYR